MPVYPRDLTDIGYEVTTVHSQRQALTALNKSVPDVIVAEFNYVSTFRDRISNLESLLVRLQTKAPDTRVIVVYDKEHEQHLENLAQRFEIFAGLQYPVPAKHFLEVLARAVRGSPL